MLHEAANACPAAALASTDGSMLLPDCQPSVRLFGNPVQIDEGRPSTVHLLLQVIDASVHEEQSSRSHCGDSCMLLLQC
jgi:hypothetical protein